MITIGIDPGSKRLAFASLSDVGHIEHRVHVIPDELRGAQRLHFIRALTVRQLKRTTDDVATITVEIPWARSGSSFVLLSIAGVLLEAAHHTHPGAVILDQPTHVWKLDSVGFGNASKAEVMAHAIGLGLQIDDQDVADALCMAQAGWAGWSRQTAAVAA